MSKNPDKSTKELAQKKDTLSDHKQNKVSPPHSANKQQIKSYKVLVQSNDHGQAKKQALTQKQKNMKDQNKKNQQKVGSSPTVTNQKPSIAKNQKPNDGKNTKQLKQKLLKISKSKQPQKQQNPQSNTKKIQTTQKTKQNPSPKIQKPQNNIIKLNQQKILNQTKLLAKNNTPQQLCTMVPLSKVQNQRLKQYFTHLYAMIKTYPKKATFQDVRNLCETINMTGWMLFCKNLGITERIKGTGTGLHLLSFIFKKYEDVQRRLDYEKFSLAVRQVILEIVNNPELNRNQNINQPVENNKENSNENENTNPSEQNKDKINEILEWLYLNDKKKHTTKLKQMGMMCSEEVYTIQKPPLKINKIEASSKDNKDNSPPPRQQRNSLPNTLQSSSLHQYQQTNQINSPSSPTTTKKKLPKIYRTHQQRKQSKLMHNLGVLNINKVTPTQDTKDFLEKYIGNDDRYLKQYFNKQDNVKNGVLARLENSQKSNSKNNRGLR